MEERRMQAVTEKTVWTADTYALHNEAMRSIEVRLQDERDKRHTEGNELRAMALKIKETADEKALELAREAQIYKDARNEIMREQSLRDNGVYATRADLTSAIQEIRSAIQPLSDYITGQRGGAQAGRATKDNGFKIIAAISSILAILGVFAAVVMAVMK